MWAPDYITGDDLAGYVNADTDNAYVDDLVTAASRAVDDWCHRQFGRLDTAAAFVYGPDALSGQLGGRWLLAVDDISDTTGMLVDVDGTTVAAGADGYDLWPRNAIAKGGVYTHLLLTDRPVGDFLVTVTALFGWPAVPPSVKTATRLQGSRWHSRRESPFGTTGSPAEGTELRLSARLDPDVRAALRSSALVRARRPR